jgi:hypothetical protein
MIQFTILLVMLSSSIPAPSAENRQEMMSILRRVKEQEMQAWLEAMNRSPDPDPRLDELDPGFARIDLEIHLDDETIVSRVENEFECLIDGISEVVLDFHDEFEVDSVFGNALSHTLSGETLTVELDRSL